MDNFIQTIWGATPILKKQFTFYLSIVDDKIGSKASIKLTY